MTPVSRVDDAIATRREHVNDAIIEQLPIDDPERLYEASRYLLDAGGKRLRPAILLLAAEAITEIDPHDTDYRRFPSLSGGEVDILTAAVSIEVIQSFTLIHDDIMDDDDLRRGVPAVHQEYDLETAILAGDTLYSKAFEYMLKTGAAPDRSVRAMDALARTCTEICEGQALDVGFESRTDVTIEEYMEMIQFKTAVLYAVSASIPAILLGADDEIVDALYGYGLDIGRAFQIQDDLLDLTVSSDTLGKRRGSDLIEGKRTIITLHARDAGIDIETLVGSDPDEAAIEAAVERLEDAGSIEYAREMALGFVASGKSHLEMLPSGESRRLLEGIADFLVEREY
ncbi:MAG: geranylfarnesyl diphosphate synthase [Natronomonas sp.]